MSVSYPAKKALEVYSKILIQYRRHNFIWKYIETIFKVGIQ